MQLPVLHRRDGDGLRLHIHDDGHVRGPLREGNGLALHYSDPATPDLTIVRGPLQEASFAYLDHEGQWHEQWNPAPDDRQRLPRLVRFQASTGKGELFWLVPLLADPIPLDMMRPDQFMSGGGDGI